MPPEQEAGRGEGGRENYQQETLKALRSTRDSDFEECAENRENFENLENFRRETMMVSRCHFYMSHPLKQHHKKFP